MKQVMCTSRLAPRPLSPGSKISCRDLFTLSHFTEHPTGIISRESLHVAVLLRGHHASYSQPAGWEAKEAAAVLGTRA